MIWPPTYLLSLTLTLLTFCLPGAYSCLQLLTWLCSDLAAVCSLCWECPPSLPSRSLDSPHSLLKPEATRHPLPDTVPLPSLTLKLSCDPPPASRTPWASSITELTLFFWNNSILCTAHSHLLQGKELHGTENFLSPLAEPYVFVGAQRILLNCYWDIRYWTTDSAQLLNPWRVSVSNQPGELAAPMLKFQFGTQNATLKEIVFIILVNSAGVLLSVYSLLQKYSLSAYHVHFTALLFWRVWTRVNQPWYRPSAMLFPPLGSWRPPLYLHPFSVPLSFP